VNYHPIPWPKYEAPIVEMLPNNRELWRVANTSANSIIDVQLIYDGKVQPLEIVGIDAVPTGTEDPGGLAKPIVRDHFLLPPAGRVEFIMKGPSLDVKKAQLLALNVDTGPIGDSDPERPILNIKASTEAKLTMTLPKVDRSEKIRHAFGRFKGLFQHRVKKSRILYFSQVLSDPNDSESPTDFFITEEGATPVLFNSNNPPAITVRQNTVEDWTIENRTLENHEFHIHQIHFLLLEQNGKKVTRSEKQFYDTIQVPYWSGSGPYPSIKVRMDFRGDIVGDFLYHCHILAHEDSGMMAKISVIP
jgi:FtsP/CotA-like multicopper oxidase with cupredoxin domain